MNKYEGIFIFKADLDEKKLGDECAGVEQTIEKHKGKIEKSENWGKKRLTYTIKKFREGFFLYLVFEAEPGSIKTFTEIFKINNNILRTQITRREE